MKSKKLFFTILLTCAFSSVEYNAMGGTLMLRFGPPSVGNGGSNPLGIPPGPTDMELSWITASNWETNLSVSPGFFVGKRQTYDQCYISLGGGVVLDANGSGLGPYSAFGCDSSGSFKFNIEYKQALGITSSGLISPYALRIGVGYAF